VRLCEIVARGQAQRAQVEAELVASLAREGIPADHALVERAADLVEDQPWKPGWRPQGQARKARGRATAAVRIAAAWGAFAAALGREDPANVRAILGGFAPELRAVERAIDAEAEVAQAVLDHCAAPRRRPENPETAALLTLWWCVEPLRIPRKQAARWLSWYARRFVGVDRTAASLEQMIRNAAK